MNNLKPIATIFTTGLVAVFAVNTPIKPDTIPQKEPDSQVKSEVKFICAESFDRHTNQRLPTTFAWTPRGKVAIVRWESNKFPGYSPQKRCQEATPRFQIAYENGTINTLTNGVVNGRSVICTARQENDSCQTLLLTLRAEDNSLEVLNQFQAIFNPSKTESIKHVVNKFHKPSAESSSSHKQLYLQINIEEFLRNAPVERS